MNHATSDGVWVVTWRSGTGRPTLGYDALVEECLCFGWIDSLTKRLDDERRMQLVTPRKPRSIWSRSNKTRIERLQSAGRMTSAGVAVVERAKADGSWTMADAAENLEEPEDLAAALDARPAARAQWNQFRPSLRRGILWWVMSAKRPETRARRVAAVVDAAARGMPAVGG